jgi:hypothetical protein
MINKYKIIINIFLIRITNIKYLNEQKTLYVKQNNLQQVFDKSRNILYI